MFLVRFIIISVDCLCIFQPPRPMGHSPYIANATPRNTYGTRQGRRINTIISLDKIMSQKGVKPPPPLLCFVASRGCFSLLSYFKTPPLCFATQNIG
nr:MAG TPA: hypothetical protein [Bacteriophage sp.]